MWSNVWHSVVLPGGQTVTVTNASSTVGALEQVAAGPQSTTIGATFAAAEAMTCCEDDEDEELLELLELLELVELPPQPARPASASPITAAMSARAMFPLSGRIRGWPRERYWMSAAVTFGGRSEGT